MLTLQPQSLTTLDKTKTDQCTILIRPLLLAATLTWQICSRKLSFSILKTQEKQGFDQQTKKNYPPPSILTHAHPSGTGREQPHQLRSSELKALSVGMFGPRLAPVGGAARKAMPRRRQGPRRDYGPAGKPPLYFSLPRSVGVIRQYLVWRGTQLHSTHTHISPSTPPQKVHSCHL